MRRLLLISLKKIKNWIFLNQCDGCRDYIDVIYDPELDAYFCAGCILDMEEHPDCTCYEPEFGHQMGCAYYGRG